MGDGPATAEDPNTATPGRPFWRHRITGEISHFISIDKNAKYKRAQRKEDEKEMKQEIEQNEDSDLPWEMVTPPDGGRKFWRHRLTGEISHFISIDKNAKYRKQQADLDEDIDLVKKDFTRDSTAQGPRKWAPGSRQRPITYRKGEKVQHKGKVCACLQAHQGYGDRNWAPGLAHSLWRHAK